MMHTQPTPVPNPPYGTSSTASPLLGAVPATSCPNLPAGRHSARNTGRVDYDEAKYTEAEFNERNQSPKAAPQQTTGPVGAEIPAVAQLPAVATCIPRLGRGLPSRAVHAATAPAQETPLDTTPTATNATDAQAIAETFLRAASSSSAESDFSTPSVATSPTASAATSATVPTTAADADATAANKKRLDALGAASTRTAGLSTLEGAREKMKPNVLPAPSAAAVPPAKAAPSAPPAPVNQASQEAPGDIDMPDAAGKEPMEEISTGGNFALFMAQSAPVQHPFMLELENLFNNKTMTTKMVDGDKTIVALFQFANIVHGHPVNDSNGHDIVKRHLDNAKHKSALEKYGIYEITTQRKNIVPAMTLIGLKEFLSKLNCEFADRFRAYEHYISTLVEASDPTNKKLINNFMEANALSSNAYVEQARDFVAQERASAGPSLAAPPELVPDVEEAGAPDVEEAGAPDIDEAGAPDVEEAGMWNIGFKRKTCKDVVSYFWNGLPIHTELGRTQYELDMDAKRKNEATGMKIMKGAEAVGVKAKGLAEAADIKENTKVKSFVMRTAANANAIKIEAEADKTKADAEKTKAETAVIMFELAQKQAAAGVAAGAKTSTRRETPEEEAKRLAKNKRARDDRAKKNALRKNNVFDDIPAV